MHWPPLTMNFERPINTQLQAFRSTDTSSLPILFPILIGLGQERPVLVVIGYRSASWNRCWGFWWHYAWCSIGLLPTQLEIRKQLIIFRVLLLWRVWGYKYVYMYNVYSGSPYHMPELNRVEAVVCLPRMSNFISRIVF